VLRPTREQIDAGIVDAAAAMFAQHGYERTSLREIAQRVGYSKTGLLHRFASKEVLRDAVAEQCVAAVRGVLAGVEHLPPGPARDTAVVEALADLAVSAPGRLSLALAREGGLEGTSAGQVLSGVPELLLACFAVEDRACTGTGLERRVRVASALAVLGTVTVTFARRAPQELRPHMVAIALQALGHAPPGPAAPRLPDTPTVR
jgi:AcrR family transcriptional regulator